MLDKRSVLKRPVKLSTIMINGEERVLLSEPTAKKPGLQGDFLAIPADWLGKAGRLSFGDLRPFLYGLAREQLTGKTRLYTQKLNETQNLTCACPPIFIKDQKTRWAACNLTGRIHYNWRMVMMPDWVQDAVVAHECAHLSIPNHSQAFYTLLDQLYPSHRDADQWLKEFGRAMLHVDKNSVFEVVSLD